jgi:hypothetical protein
VIAKATYERLGQVFAVQAMPSGRTTTRRILTVSAEDGAGRNSAVRRLKPTALFPACSGEPCEQAAIFASSITNPSWRCDVSLTKQRPFRQSDELGIEPT